MIGINQSVSKRSHLIVLSVITSLFLMISSAWAGDYAVLKSLDKSFPDAGTGIDKRIVYYLELSDAPRDSHTFSIYIPAGTEKIEFGINSSLKSTLFFSLHGKPSHDVSSRSSMDLQELEQRDGAISVSGGGHKAYPVVGGNTSHWDKGRWLYCEFDNDKAVPNAYQVIYRINTEHHAYNKPEGHPEPPEDSDIPEGETPSDSADEDPVYNEPPSDRPDNPLSYLDGTDRENPFGSDEKTGDDDEQQDPPVQTQAPELNGITGYQQAMTQVQEVPAAHLDENSYLAPKLNLELDRVPSGNNGQIEAAGYAMLEINGNFYTVVPDVLGNLSLMPIGEVGVRPYCTEVEIDLENSAWYCNAFEIIQDFFAVNNINGIEQLQEWHAQGENIIFYFGFAPGGNLDEFQGAAFQIVR